MRVVLVPLLLCTPASALAVTLTVGPAATYSTIEDAVAAAQAGDRIEVEAGVYDERAIVANVDLEIIGLGGSAATRWNGPQGGGFGNNSSPTLVVVNGATVTLEGFTMTSGADTLLRVDGADLAAADLQISGHSGGGGGWGGGGGGGSAIVVVSGTLSLDSSVLDGNTTGIGGGHLRAIDSVVTVTASDLVGGTAETGGALWSDNSDILLDGVVMDGNSVDGTEGGAVWIDGGTLEIQSGTYTDNTAQGSWGGGGGAGAALFVTGGAQITLVGATFEDNIAEETGGAIRLQGSTQGTVDGCTFLGNNADFGGAIYVGTTGDIDVIGTRFEANAATAGNGGAIRQRIDGGATLTILDSLFEANGATGFGGAVATTSATGGQQGALIMDGCDVFNNTAADGGGLSVANVASVEGTHLRVCTNVASGNGGGLRVSNAGSSDHRWSNSLFTENNAGGAGGGLFMSDADPGSLLNNTLLGNGAPDGGGVYTDTTALDIRNVLIAFTAGGDGLTGPPFPGVEVSYSLFWDNVSADLPVPLQGGAGMVYADPLLSAVSADGDCTNDEPWPLAGSPTIDAGDPAYTDPDGSTSDIGVYGGPDAAWDDFADNDNDGFPGVNDCDDDDPAVNPDADELCNGIDDDCDAEVDEDATDAPSWYEDEDNDGYGVTIESVISCDPPNGYAAEPGDCNDASIDVHPDALEVCNDIDDNCDGVIDEGTPNRWWKDEDADGFGDGQSVPVEDCDPPDGHVDNDLDCDDADATVNPDAEDPPGDDIDANCDGVDGIADPTAETVVDEGLSIRSACGCASGPLTPAGPLALLGLLLLAGRRSREVSSATG